MIFTPRQHQAGVKSTNKVGGTCGMHGREEGFVQIFSGGNQWQRKTRERPKCGFHDNIEVELTEIRL